MTVRLQPGTYRCTWHLPHDEEVIDLPGELSLKSNRQPEGAIFADIPGVWTVNGSTRSAGFPQDDEFPALKCSLDNGLQAILLDCSSMIWAPNRAAIYARCALVGNRIDSDSLSIDRLKIQISGIDSLFGKSPIKGHSMPTERGVPGVGTWSVEQNPESTQIWEDEDAKLTASFDSSIAMADPYYFRMCHSPSILIDTKAPIDFDSAVQQWVEPLTDLAALALGKPQRITYLALGSRNGKGEKPEWDKLQVYGSGIYQEPFNSSLKEIRENHSVIEWSTDDRSPLEALRCWQILNSSHHPLVETYGSFLNVQTQHPRARYLLLLQALEGLHGYENKDIEEAEAERHRTKKSEIVEKLKTCFLLSAKERKFLKSNISNRPPKGLDWRLRESFSRISAAVMQDLEKTDLVRSVMTDDRKPNDAADALRIIRNDLAHGNKGYPVEDLDAVAKVLERVARAHFLRILGYCDSIQKRAVSVGRH
ncbi:HEPN domain-containing protein [Streptomyces bauhiniae]|uniref:ApeA N-terminal domain 1-containing protein n=1 Tax=Streptomyces bauhiniae TaxID=2340725 RepID=UPI003692204A